MIYALAKDVYNGQLTGFFLGNGNAGEMNFVVNIIHNKIKKEVYDENY